jgi:hypothetical protein
MDKDTIINRFHNKQGYAIHRVTDACIVFYQMVSQVGHF